MQNRSSIKNRKPTDINQLAKSIVDLVTGNPIAEDLPAELKKRQLTITRRDRVKRDIAGTEKQKDSAKKVVRSR